MSIPSAFSDAGPGIERDRESLVENLLVAMRAYARIAAPGRVWEGPGAVAVYSGRPAAIFNAVLLDRMVGGEDELAWIFRWAEEHYQGVGARWSLWLAEHFLAPELMSRVAKLVKPYRLAAQHRSAGMVARDLSKPRRPLPEIELRRVAAGEDRWNLCYVMSQAFVTSMETYLDAYDRGEYWETGMKGLVGYRQGQAISSACYLPGRDAVGLYGVATLPAEQRKGYGEAMVRAALEAARRESGLEKAVLQASGQAAALYRRLGFRTVTFVSVYNEVV